MRVKLNGGNLAWVLSICFLGSLAAPIAARADDIRQITLTANDIIYDPGTKEIYASVPSSVGSGGNSIVAINPETGAIGQPVFVGSEPGMLARSDDNQFLYVALNGASTVRRFDLATQTAGLTFSIGTPLHVEDMAVPPGQPHSVCIVREDTRYSPHFAGTTIYDDGVARAHSANGQDTIAFSASPWRLYAYDNSISSFDFDRLNISATGFDVPGGDQDDNLISGGNLRIRFSDGKIFVNNGEVIDPEARSILGTFSGAGYADPFVVQPGDGTAFFLTGDYSTTYTLRAFDTTTFLPTGTLAITKVAQSPGTLIRWGTNGLAFQAGNQLYLIRTSLVPSSPSSASWQTTSISVGADSKIRLLWTKPDGTASFWSLPSGGKISYSPTYGPFAGWAARKIAPGAGGATEIYWNSSSGAASHWTVSPSGAAVHSPTWGPYSGWTPTDFAANGDGTARLLWTNANGGASVWTIDAGGHVTYGLTYGPYDGWSAAHIAAAPGGATRLLWTNTNGSASVWSIAASGAATYSPTFGPFTGWTCASIGVAGDGKTRLQWNNTSGATSFWTLAANNSVTYSPVWGPFTGWSPTDFAVAPDSTVRLLWDDPSGAASFWTVAPNNSLGFSPTYGPF